MADVSSVALSGFNASEARITVAANNIANANTPNFRAGAVAQSTNQDGSVSTQFVAANPAPVVKPVTTPQVQAQQAQSPQQGNDVDITTDLVNTNFATYSAQADLKVLQTQNSLNKYLFDLQA